MDWMTTLYSIGCVSIIASVSFWLRSKMLRWNGRNSLWIQLGVVGFALITCGTALQLNYAPVTPQPLVERLLESFGFLFVVAGMIVLFILLCLSRFIAPTLGKPTSEHENSMSEYLR